MANRPFNVKLNLAYGSVAVLAMTAPLTNSIATWLDQKDSHGSFALNPVEIHILSFEAIRGDCGAAYRVRRHHLYVSLNYKKATKCFRIAAACVSPNSNAIAGLITVLRRPEDDVEVDNLISTLKRINPRYGADAQTEVELRRKGRSR